MGNAEDLQRLGDLLSEKQGEPAPEPAATQPEPQPAPDRQAIAERHGVPGMAWKLVGETAEELEADAAAKAALLRVFQPSPAKQARNEAIIRALHGEADGQAE
jgi:hypothetical protein